MNPIFAVTLLTIFCSVFIIGMIVGFIKTTIEYLDTVYGLDSIPDRIKKFFKELLL